MSRSFLSITAQLIGWVVISFLLTGWAHSCASVGPRATLSTGTVIKVDGDLVLVTFTVVTEGYADQGWNWFYIPGHGYQERDVYPDPKKDPNLRRQ